MLKHGTYCGPAALLQGKTALLQDDPVTCEGGNFGLLLAQFDDRDLVWGGDYMGFGWHAFDRNDFTITPETPDDHPAQPRRD